MYDFKLVEQEVSKLWQKQNKDIKASLQYNPKKKLFSFLEGPPTANAPPALHHVEVRVFKDLFCRFWTMKGHRVERKWGWDCHGLPIENLAEKEMGLKDKKDIERIGVAKFNEFCRSKVLHFASEWKKTVHRMGKWIEFDNSYKTMDNSYMESVWHIFKKLYDDGYVYEGKRVLL